MSTKYTRRGHYRTNADGNTFWVSEHNVEQEYYSIRTVNGKTLINGHLPLLKDRCRTCFRPIFYTYLPSKKSLYFDNNNAINKQIFKIL